MLPALVTPLNEDGDVDEDATPRLIRYVLAGGVSGVLALGSTGESASLAEPARRHYLKLVVAEVGGRVPVLCGVTRDDLAGARAEVRAAADIGADAALVAPPHYYPADQPTVLAFYRALAADAALPLFVYHIPQFTKVSTEPATLRTLAEEGAIVGVKDSSRDFEYFQRVAGAVRGLPTFRLFTGTDSMLLASMAVGGCGTICGSANVAPSWVVGLYKAVREHRWDEARERQHALVELVDAIRQGVFPSGIKSAMSILGVCEAWPAPPVAPLPGEPETRLREQLAGWGLAAAAAPTPA